MYKEGWDAFVGALFFISTFGASIGIVYAFLSKVSKMQVEKYTEEIVKKVSEQFTHFENNVNNRIGNIETNILQLTTDVSRHREELRNLNKRSEHIKTDAEIREIVKQG